MIQCVSYLKKAPMPKKYRPAYKLIQRVNAALENHVEGEIIAQKYLGSPKQESYSGTTSCKVLAEKL